MEELLFDHVELIKFKLFCVPIIPLGTALPFSYECQM